MTPARYLWLRALDALSLLRPVVLLTVLLAFSITLNAFAIIRQGQTARVLAAEVDRTDRIAIVARSVARQTRELQRQREADGQATAEIICQRQNQIFAILHQDAIESLETTRQLLAAGNTLGLPRSTFEEAIARNVRRERRTRQRDCSGLPVAEEPQR